MWIIVRDDPNQFGLTQSLFIHSSARDFRNLYATCEFNLGPLLKPCHSGQGRLCEDDKGT